MCKGLIVSSDDLHCAPKLQNAAHNILGGSAYMAAHLVLMFMAVTRVVFCCALFQVDKAVDYLLESAFGSSVLGAMVDGDSEFI